MGFIDRIKKILGSEEYDSFSLSLMSADGCVGEEVIEKLRSLFRREEPC